MALAVPDVRPFSAASNIDILNAIRHDASSDYQKRIPNATKANIDQTINDLLNYRPGVNEFVSALVNQIGLILVKSNLWTNPLAPFKRGMLEYGDTIEEINVGLIQARRYNSDRDYLEKDIFGKYELDVQSSFHKVNRQDYYPITVAEPMLRRAFQGPTGLATFVTDLMSAPTTSDQWDEFLLTTGLFKTYHDNGGFFVVNVPDIKSSESGSEEAKAFLRRVREMTATLAFLSTHYNAAHMPVSAQADDLYLFTTPGGKAAIDVEALAAAFNIDRADVPSRIIVIPDEYVNIDGFQAILTTSDFFVIADQLLNGTNAVNPVGLFDNHFLHHWQVISASRFVPAILFSSTEASTEIINVPTPVTAISAPTFYDAKNVQATDLTRGETYEVRTTVTTSPAGGDNDAARFEVFGNLSPRTYITQSGMLHVAIDDAAPTITVRVTAQDGTNFTQDVTPKLVGSIASVWPDPSVQEDADKDGLIEVTPDAPTRAGNKVTIPTVKGVQYKNGSTNVNNGDEITIVNGTPLVINATSRDAAKYELKPGATASWTYNYQA